MLTDRTGRPIPKKAPYRCGTPGDSESEIQHDDLEDLGDGRGVQSRVLKDRRIVKPADQVSSGRRALDCRAERRVLRAIADDRVDVRTYGSPLACTGRSRAGGSTLPISAARFRAVPERGEQRHPRAKAPPRA